MSIYILHLDMRSYRNDAEPALPYTHVLIGQRSTSHFRPNISEDKLKSGDLTPSERTQWAVHVNRLTNGYFSLHPLVWVSREQEAQENKGSYTAPEWENLSVVPVDVVIDHD